MVIQTRGGGGGGEGGGEGGGGGAEVGGGGGGEEDTARRSSARLNKPPAVVISRSVSRLRWEPLHSTRSGPQPAPASPKFFPSSAASVRPHAVSGRSWSFRLESSADQGRFRPSNGTDICRVRVTYAFRVIAQAYAWTRFVDSTSVECLCSIPILPSSCRCAAA